jgi:hypothetical protein
VNFLLEKIKVDFKKHSASKQRNSICLSQKNWTILKIQMDQWIHKLFQSEIPLWIGKCVCVKWRNYKIYRTRNRQYCGNCCKRCLWIDNLKQTYYINSHHFIFFYALKPDLQEMQTTLLSFKLRRSRWDRSYVNQLIDYMPIINDWFSQEQ